MNKLVPCCAWILSGALEIPRLRLKLRNKSWYKLYVCVRVCLSDSRERLKRFNDEYKGGIKFRTGTFDVLRVMGSRLREFVFGHIDTAQGKKRKSLLSKRLKILLKHEEERKAKKEKDEDSDDDSDEDSDEDSD